MFIEILFSDIFYKLNSAKALIQLIYVVYAYFLNLPIHDKPIYQSDSWYKKPTLNNKYKSQSKFFVQLL